MLIVGEWTRSVGDDVYMRLMLGGLLRLVWEIGLSGGDGDGEVGFKVHFDRPRKARVCSSRHKEGTTRDKQTVAASLALK